MSGPTEVGTSASTLGEPEGVPLRAAGAGALPEWERGLEETAFTPLLRAIVEADDRVLAAVFVDGEGECIDHCARVAPFDAMVIAAQMQALAAQVREVQLDRAGELRTLTVHGTERDLQIVRIDDTYALVVATAAGAASRPLAACIERAVWGFQFESALPRPSWMPGQAPIRVEVRTSVRGWTYAPRAYAMDGTFVTLSDVLGRWVEADAADGHDPVVCFRVRTTAGEELTLVHHVEADVWALR